MIKWVDLLIFVWHLYRCWDNVISPASFYHIWLAIEFLKNYDYPIWLFAKVIDFLSTFFQISNNLVGTNRMLLVSCLRRAWWLRTIQMNICNLILFRKTAVNFNQFYIMVWVIPQGNSRACQEALLVLKLRLCIFQSYKKQLP